MKGRERRILVIVVIAFAFLYAGGLFLQRSEAAHRSVEIDVGDVHNPDRIDVEATVQNIDHKKGDVEIRLKFAPKGKLIQENGILLAKDVTLFVNSETGGHERKFEKGKPMSPQDVVVKMYGGEFTDYPFDAFDATLEMLIAADVNGKIDTEPLAVSVSANLPGLRIDIGEETKHAPGEADVHFRISRSPLSLVVVWAVIALYWLMTLAVAALTWATVFRGLELDADILAYIAGLLFAFVAFRGTMPGDPPIGALADFIAFFWAEVTILTCLIALVVTYIRRGVARAGA